MREIDSDDLYWGTVCLISAVAFTHAVLWAVLP